MNIGKLRDTGISEAIRSVHGSHNIIYPLRGLHNVAYNNVNSAMMNGYDIMRFTFATLWILSERLDLIRSVVVNIRLTRRKGVVTTLSSFR